ncbi:DUF551 domain-containing protein [Citrobacter sp. Cf072]|uniref:DUF551 domain-containing protein n=1 Tax=Citrobacter sp. Cf072 TaxID=2985048 RepID=UPI002578C64E|nr:DUF551 domain-containing protein [Citrobacter sp. Cf072]MDM3249839.1 DUF551 domain-containing protein [Citrobacter sp. Cf072]
MTTNNHPAHGPVSLDRLHQIREILSKAAAQSDGGNLGYAMVDAVKVIDSAIAAFDAEPVAWTEKCEITNMQATGLYLRGFPNNAHGRDIALYTAPPAPVIEDDFDASRLAFESWVTESYDSRLMRSGTGYAGQVLNQMWQCWLACRAAMIQSGNYPVIPDGWVMVPKVPTEAMCETGHIGVDVYTGMATEGDGYYSIGGDDAARVYEFMVATAPKQENTMNDITKLSAKLVSVGMFEQLSFHDGFPLKCRELGIHASKLGHIELSKKAKDLMFSASLQQHDQLVDNMASLIELMADKYMSDKWIPVSDRMPEGMKTVITSNGFDIGQGWWDGECWKSFDCHDVVPGKVTHWMPLPAAPQQEVK